MSEKRPTSALSSYQVSPSRLTTTSSPIKTQTIAKNKPLRGPASKPTRNTHHKTHSQTFHQSSNSPLRLGIYTQPSTMHEHINEQWLIRDELLRKSLNDIL